MGAFSEASKLGGSSAVRRFSLRLVGLTTCLTALGAAFTTTAFAAAGPFMPCCFNQATGALNNMACCIHQIAMACCQRFF